MTATTLDETLLTETGIPVLRPGTDEYDTARALWNAMIDRRPRLIVQPRSTAEVSTAVRFALANNLPIAVKGAGHSTPSYSMCDDDGIVVDLARLNQANVDRNQAGVPAGRRAPVRTRRCDRYTRPRGSGRGDLAHRRGRPRGRA